MGKSEGDATATDSTRRFCPVCKCLEVAVTLEQGLRLIDILQRSTDGCVTCGLVADTVSALDGEQNKSEALIIGWDTMRIQGLRIVVGDADRFLYGIDMYAPAGQPVPWHVAKNPEQPMEISGNTGSDAAFRTLQSWIEKCCTEHSCQLRLVSPLPTRVLNISDPRHAFLYCPKAEETGRYACLSHCWGTSRTLRTTIGNVLEQEDGILWDELPRVFQDTATLVSKLGIPYLWIDSLCIIQDSVEDWQRESAKMADVYANSTVTIAASLAAGDSESLFASSPDMHISRVVETPGFRNIRVRRTLGHGHGPQPLPLMGRAWVLQERLLAPRVLHFTGEELVWECMEQTTCECGCIRSLWSPGHVPFDKDLLYERVLSGASRADVKDRWRRLVEEYSRLKLTLDRDRLPAVSGAARRFATGLGGCEYLAGLWGSSGLVSDLLWERKVPSEPPKRLESLPSWSWVSLGTEVQYEGCRAVEELAVILEARCFYSDSGDMFGEISGGVIRLSATVLSVSASHLLQRGASSLVASSGSKASDELVLDEPELEEDWTRCFAARVAIRRQLYNTSASQEMWLVIRRVEDVGQVYRRIGLLKIQVLAQGADIEEEHLPEPQIISIT